MSNEVLHSGGSCWLRIVERIFLCRSRAFLWRRCDGTSDERRDTIRGQGWLDGAAAAAAAGGPAATTIGCRCWAVRLRPEGAGGSVWHEVVRTNARDLAMWARRSLLPNAEVSWWEESCHDEP
ncbi:uncharacterized protein CANTADRAFT_250855 [Suhomyces tanzawaensis NRRL Y-17324]|uniref:Uncharacterized protein n=1 Tax=Suhomyces tanzawaensis NRRL Y-17324 TaxID=984487 RepID=A0A1E4SIB0_9ASCO|nr:uncharacterized protein CANTADRAFT_250855 [Suhomyces tanzawaensis NRRL Y-17324]ODV79246.1 hypothetical protein CANTADRAFT_250855 [Suhomyces tanzawaensis NRRL Y-17324]